MMPIMDVLMDLNPHLSDPRAPRSVRFPKRRSLQKVVLARLSRKDRRAIVVRGPRQVGKTVLLRQLVDDLREQGWPPSRVIYFAFDDHRLTTPVSPRNIVSAVEARMQGERCVFLCDEVGTSPRWDLWLKQAVDEGKHRYVVTDSSARLLRESGRDTGTGRWDEFLMEPLCFQEYLTLRETVVGTSPDPVALYLDTTGFPEHLWEEDADLVRQRLREDTGGRSVDVELARAKVDIDRAGRLFAYFAWQSGAIFNARKLASRLGVDQRSIGQWLKIIEDTMLVFRLPRWTKAAASALRSHPKVFVADHGIVRAFSPTPSPELGADVRGRMFETVVFRHLREVARERGAELAYLRDRNVEIDFVVTHAGSVVAVEVTSSEIVRADKLSAVRRAADRAGAKSTWLVYGGWERIEETGVVALPMHEFLPDPDLVLEHADG